MSQRPWFTYLLRCSDNTLYCGISTNLSKRVKIHNTGKGAKYTRARLPVELAYQEECVSESAAKKREAEIKKLTRQKKIQLIESA